MKYSATLGFLLLLLFVQGCFTVDEGDPSNISGLRILSIASTPPETNGEDDLELSALVVDPHGNGRTIEYSWYLCTALLLAEVEGSPFEQSSCADLTFLEFLGTGETYEATALTEEGVPEGEEIQIPIVLWVQAGADLHRSLKRVTVTSSPENGNNPVITGLDINGEDPGPSSAAQVSRSSSVSLRAMISDAGDENALSSQFFVVGGGINNHYDGATAGTWQTPSQASDVIMYVVARDGRGGNAWLQRNVSIE